MYRVFVADHLAPFFFIFIIYFGLGWVRFCCLLLGAQLHSVGQASPELLVIALPQPPACSARITGTIHLPRSKF